MKYNIQEIEKQLQDLWLLVKLQRTVVVSLASTVQSIEFNVGTAATTASVTSLTAATRIRRVVVKVTTQYSNNTDIFVGNTATANLFLAAGVNLQQLGTYSSGDIDILNTGGQSVMQATLTNAPAQGACVVTVDYVITPNT